MIKSENTNFRTQVYNKINNSEFNSTNYKYKNQSNIKNLNPFSTLPVFSNFKGFFNKKFNLTNYKNERDDSRSRSKSSERIYKTNIPRGNGIPTDALERIIYLGNIFKKDSFQKYYNNRPQRKTSEITDVCDYIVKFRKTHSELESAMMAFYFVSHEIKYDNNYYNIDENDNDKEKKIKTNKKIRNLKNSQKPENVYKKGKALN